MNLKDRIKRGLARQLRPISSRRNGKIHFDEREYIDFSSNDYLGLAGHPRLIEAAKEALDQYGTSSSASRLLSGDLQIHHRLEEALAIFKNKESSLVFNSGYQANIGIISSICVDGGAIFLDRLCHASIVDGALLSRAKHFRFLHNDLNHLEYLLKGQRQRFKNGLIITESIFSMDGDVAPLKGLVGLKDKYDCRLMVDEAHATGIFGENGSGVVEEEGLSERVDLVMGTFGKALGGFGAYLASSKDMIEYLINTCRSFIYSTGLPPAVAATNLASLELVRQEAGRRKKLRDISRYFREELKGLGFDVRGASQIVPVVVGENSKASEMAEVLQDRGWWVLPIRPPTVPAGEARLRFSLNFYHDRQMLRRLIDDISSFKI